MLDLQKWEDRVPECRTEEVERLTEMLDHHLLMLAEDASDRGRQRHVGAVRGILEGYCIRQGLEWKNNEDGSEYENWIVSIVSQLPSKYDSYLDTENLAKLIACMLVGERRPKRMYRIVKAWTRLYRG